MIRPTERILLIPSEGKEVDTLLQTLAGDIEEDEGSIAYEGEQVVYVSLETVFDGTESLALVLHKRPTFLCINASTLTSSVALEELKAFIASFRGGMILASKNEELITAARVTKIIEIQPSTKELISYTGKYSDYLIERAKMQTRIEEAYEKQQREKARLENWLDKKRTEANGRPQENGAVIRAKARYLQKEILDKEIPNPHQPE